MKKIAYALILLFISITIVNAQPCFIITGTGKNIGDEIACGTEHFYVVSNDGEEVKMLGKYNLLTNITYDYLKLDNYEYTYNKDIYKNKVVQDRINETGILLSEYNIESTYDKETQKYTATAISGVVYDNKKYKIIVPKEESITKSGIVTKQEVKKYINEGYLIDEILYSNSTGKYFGVILYKEDNAPEVKTIFLDGQKRPLSKAMELPEVKMYLDQGYAVKNSYYDSYSSYIADYYAIVLSKSDSSEYKTIFLDGTYKTYPELFNTPEVKSLLEQGYKISNKYYDDNKRKSGKIAYNYQALTFSKSKDTDWINIIFEEDVTLPSNVDFYDDYVPSLEIAKEKIAEGYQVYTWDWNYSEYINSQSHYYAASLYKSNYEETYDKIYQDEKAIGINGDVDGPNYPIYGLVYQDSELSGLRRNEEYREGESYGGGYYQDFDISSHTYFENYLHTLQDMGYPITSVSTLSVKDLNDLTKTITGKELPIEEWYENRNVIEDEYSWSEHAVLGNIKDLYDGKHDWIWSTAYWLKTVDPNEDIYDINTMGDLCLTDVCSSTPSRGFRPLVTIAAKDIVYKIETKTDGNGEVKADYVEAQGGTVVKFTVTPKEGYVLGEVKVTDANGNIVIFKDYTFTMPNANVTIEAIFIPKNPNTIDIILITFATLLISGITLTYINYRKTKLR